MLQDKHLFYCVYRWCVMTLLWVSISVVLSILLQLFVLSILPLSRAAQTGLPLWALGLHLVFQSLSVSLAGFYRVIEMGGWVIAFTITLGSVRSIQRKSRVGSGLLWMGLGLLSLWLMVWMSVYVECYTPILGFLFSTSLLLNQDFLHRLQPSYQAFSTEWITLWKLFLKGAGWGSGIAVLSALFYQRYLSGFWMNRILPYFTRKAHAEDRLTDIRTVRRIMSSAMDNKKYDPREYFQNDRLFLGLKAKGEPLYLPRSQWLENHVHILGGTGMGKTLAACNVLVQCMRFGDSVWVIEGKRDQWALPVLKAEATALGRSFYCIDLNDATAQFNLLSDISTNQLIELFDAGFALGNVGLPSDHYKKWDRKLARFAAQLYEPSQSFSELYYRLMIDDREELPALRKEANGFCLSLEEIAMLGCLKTREGVNLKQAVAEGSVVYIVGSLRNEAVLTLQKMLLVRWMQCVEAHNHPRVQRPAVMLLDEFTTMLSKPALQGVSTIRDKGGQMILAHQSMGNLNLTTSDMSAEHVQSTIKANTGIKIFFKVNDRKEQEMMSEATNEIVIPHITQKIIRNPTLSEHLLSEKRITYRERSLITPEMISVMSAGQAIVMGVEPTAVLTHWAAYPVQKGTLAITPAAGLAVKKPTRSIRKKSTNKVVKESTHKKTPVQAALDSQIPKPVSLLPAKSVEEIFVDQTQDF